jgi:hypothetical protein
MKNLAMAGGLLQVFAFGAGAFSLDSRATRHHRADSRRPEAAINRRLMVSHAVGISRGRF